MHILEENKHAIKFQVLRRDGVYGARKEPRNFSVIDMCGIISNLYYLFSCARMVP